MYANSIPYNTDAHQHHDDWKLNFHFPAPVMWMPNDITVTNVMSFGITITIVTVTSYQKWHICISISIIVLDQHPKLYRLTMASGSNS